MGAIRDDVVFRTCVECSNGDHPRLQRFALAADDPLHRNRDLRSDIDRVLPSVGRGAVGADPMHDDINAVRRAVLDAFARAHLARCKGRRHVKGQGIIRLWEARVKPVLKHRLGAADPLFGGLYDEEHGALPSVLHGGEPLRRPNHRRDVHVMAACMHHRRLDAIDTGLARL